MYKYARPAPTPMGVFYSKPYAPSLRVYVASSVSYLAAGGICFPATFATLSVSLFRLERERCLFGYMYTFSTISNLACEFTGEFL